MAIDLVYNESANKIVVLAKTVTNINNSFGDLYILNFPSEMVDNIDNYDILGGNSLLENNYDATSLKAIGGDLIISGNTNELGDNNIQGYVTVLSSNNSFKINKTYGGGNNDKIAAAILTSDGGYAFAGTAGSSSQNTMISLIKTDSEGNLNLTSEN